MMLWLGYTCHVTPFLVIIWCDSWSEFIETSTISWFKISLPSSQAQCLRCDHLRLQLSFQSYITMYITWGAHNKTKSFHTSSNLTWRTYWRYIIEVVYVGKAFYETPSQDSQEIFVHGVWQEISLFKLKKKRCQHFFFCFFLPCIGGSGGVQIQGYETGTPDRLGKSLIYTGG